MKLQTPLRRLLALVAAAALALAAGRDVYRHSEVIPGAWTAGGVPCLWVDYGRVHVYLGGNRDFEGVRFHVLWWECQSWSWGAPGHRNLDRPR